MQALKILHGPGAVLFMLLTATTPVRADEQIRILGWLEHAVEASTGLKMDAKLDTGALTAAIDADILSTSDEDDLDQQRNTVVFRISNEDGGSATLEKEIVRQVEIKKRGGGTETRPVVMMTLCIAGVEVEGEVSLDDRSGFNYPLLIGRKMLAEGHILVDADKIYTLDPDCN